MIDDCFDALKPINTMERETVSVGEMLSVYGER